MKSKLICMALPDIVKGVVVSVIASTGIAATAHKAKAPKPLPNMC